MDTKRLLVISWIVTALIFICTISAYLLQFGANYFSKNPEHWGQFGDYIGGVLNPILTLVSLVVLTYISIGVSKIEDRRNQFTLQELARPLAQIICGDYENLILVKFKNCGMGPLTIKNISIIKNEQLIDDVLINVMPKAPNGIFWKDFVIDGKNFIVAKDDEVNFLRLEVDTRNPIFTSYRTSVRQTLKDLRLEVTYVDIYDRKMEPAKRDFTLFGRTLS